MQMFSDATQKLMQMKACVTSYFETELDEKIKNGRANTMIIISV